LQFIFCNRFLVANDIFELQKLVTNNKFSSNNEKEKEKRKKEERKWKKKKKKRRWQGWKIIVDFFWNVVNETSIEGQQSSKPNLNPRLEHGENALRIVGQF
jgi:hypothetical protein